MIKLIVAMDEQGCIGKQGKLPWHCPQDLKHFFDTIQQHPLLMGKNTFDGYVPKNNPIHVVTHQEILCDHRIHVCKDLPLFLKQWPKDDILFICGGASIYEQCFPYVEECYISIIDGIYEGDTYFPKLDFSDFTLSKKQRKEGFTLYHYVK